LKFESAEQREEILVKMNDLLLSTNLYFRNEGLPRFEWKDFTPKPESETELNDLSNETKEALMNLSDPEKPIQLQVPDYRPAWRKLFGI